ncbi:MAG: hypothetical protein AAF500_05675 [Myxococcota bacterium]
MKRFVLPSFVLGLVVSGVLSAPTARAQDALTGSWTLVASSTETAQRRSAIEAATQDLPSFMRARASERLTERTTPLSELRITVKGDQVELTGRRKTLRLTVGGPAVPLEAEGRRASARATRRSGDLVVKIEGDNGFRTTTYRPSKDGQRLVLDVEFHPQRLSTPVRYQVTYISTITPRNGD